jgi:hypothetical protein
MLRITKRTFSDIFKKKELTEELIYIRRKELEKLKNDIYQKEKILQNINKEIGKKFPLSTINIKKE